MPFVDDLLDQARSLAAVDAIGKPKQANLRRAISAAYYALFHETTDKASRAVLGGEVATDALGARVSRVFEHKSVLVASKWFAGGSASVPPSIQAARGVRANGAVDPRLVAVCNAVVELQEERHKADYDLWSVFLRLDVNQRIDRAALAIGHLRALSPVEDAHIFLLGCLLGERLKKNE